MIKIKLPQQDNLSILEGKGDEVPRAEGYQLLRDINASGSHVAKIEDNKLTIMKVLKE